MASRKSSQAVDRDAFLAANPRCCYCNGSRATVEIDHAPARICFRRKQGPEGFEFPSCSECNRAVAKSEQVAALYIRMFDQNDANFDGDDLVKLVTGVANNSSEAMPILPEQRYTTLGNPIMDRTATIPPGAHPHIELFATKMLYAMFYRVSGRFAGPGHRRMIDWAQLGTAKADFLRGNAERWFDAEQTGNRRNVDLGDQFHYRHGYNAAHGYIGMTMLFGQSLCFFCVLGPASGLGTLRPRPAGYKTIRQIGESIRISNTRQKRKSR